MAEAAATNRTPKKRGRPIRGWQDRFLHAYRNSCNVRASCEAAGVSRTTVWRMCKRSPAFDEAMREAEQDGVDILEAAARQRAIAMSDTLLIFLLKAHRPEKYRETVRIELLRKEAADWAETYGLPDPEAVLREAERLTREGV